MYKALLILDAPEYEIGGVQEYNRTLINIMKDEISDIKIDELVVNSSYHYDLKKEKELIRYFYATDEKRFLTNVKDNIFVVNKARELLKELDKKNDYNIIISSSYTIFNNFLNSTKFYWVQHNDIDVYTKAKNIKEPIKRILVYLFRKFILRNKNPFKKTKNVIALDQENANCIKEKYGNYSTPIIPSCQECQKTKTNINPIKNNKIIFFGRIDNNQKNINGLIELNKNLKHKIDFYGPKPNEEKDLKYYDELVRNNWYCGQVTKDNSQMIIPKYNYAILLSNFEGFPLSLMESLCFGVPIILRNAFLSAKYICNSKTGLLLNNAINYKKTAKEIDNFIDENKNRYSALSSSAKEFYMNNLNFQDFKNKWMTILNKHKKHL